MQREPSRIFLAFTLALAASKGATAGSASNLEKQVNDEYRGKVLTLRQFCTGPLLHFDTDGRLIGKVGKTSWTTDAQLEVEGLKLKGNVLELKGRRLRLIFDPSRNQFRDVLTVSPGDEVAKGFRNPRDNKAWEELVKGAGVEVDLELASAPQQESELVTTIDKVFVSSNEAIVDFAPSFWKDFLLRKDVNSPPPPPESDASISKAGGNVTQPRILSQPNPEYSEAARQAGYTGALVLRFIVTAEGHVRDVSIVIPLGLGLDENAVETISRWTFDPARKDGTPVAVRLSTQVDFHLY